MPKFPVEQQVGEVGLALIHSPPFQGHHFRLLHSKAGCEVLTMPRKLLISPIICPWEVAQLIDAFADFVQPVALFAQSDQGYCV